MSTLIVSEFVTLDGVMEAPGGEPRPLAGKMNAMPKHVASTTLRDPQWELVDQQAFPTGVMALTYHLER